MNGFGLMYNDAHTSSLGKGFEVNIQSSNAGGKFHEVKCMFCGTKNRISLAQIKEKLEFDKKVLRAKLGNSQVSDEDKYIDNIKGSMMSFRCGKCGMSVSTTISKDDVEIYTTQEYQEKVKTDLSSVAFKANGKGMAKDKYLDFMQEEKLRAGGRK